MADIVARGTTEIRTPERMRRILAAVEQYGSKTAGASAGGISTVTLRKWVSEDPDFELQMEIARGNFERDQLARISSAADEPRNWMASAWMLERTFPDRYALGRGRTGGDDASVDGVIPQQVAILIQQVLVNQTPVSRQVVDSATGECCDEEDVVDGVLVEDAEAPRAIDTDRPPATGVALDLVRQLVRKATTA